MKGSGRDVLWHYIIAATCLQGMTGTTKGFCTSRTLISANHLAQTSTVLLHPNRFCCL